MTGKLSDLKTRLEKKAEREDPFDSLLETMLDELALPPTEIPKAETSAPPPPKTTPKRRDWTGIIVLAVFIWFIVAAVVVSRVL